MSVRSEKAEDRSAIATLIARTYMEDGASTIEQTGSLRTLESYDNDLAFVCDDSDKLKAFSLYTPVEVNGKGGSVILAPFAIDANDESFDVVSYLEDTFSKVASKEYRYIFVMGNLDDLSSLGFVFADSLGFSLAGNPPVSLLVKDLGEGSKLEGQVNMPDILLA